MRTAESSWGQIMWGDSRQSHERENPDSNLDAAFLALLEAHACAEDTGSERWEFAIAIRRFRELGLSETDLRWLVRKGYVDHAKDVTRLEDQRREFRPSTNLSFCKKTCFALTDAGVSRARSLKQAPVELLRPAYVAIHRNGDRNDLSVPHWDAATRELRIEGRIIKRFKWQAVNQELVLSAFQEDGWPTVIDDPLPPKPEQDAKRRLHDTIKALNRNHEHPAMRFHGNGTGEGVRWECIDSQ